MTVKLNAKVRRLCGDIINKDCNVSFSEVVQEFMSAGYREIDVQRALQLSTRIKSNKRLAPLDRISAAALAVSAEEAPCQYQ